jgi:hypothetical protein
MSENNILIGEDETLSRVIDWEAVCVVPLWMACDYPHFLMSGPLDVEPNPCDFPGGEENEYYHGLWVEYELTRLRGVFLDEMRKLQPGWVQVYASSQRERDFELAVSSFDDPIHMWKALRWLEDVESGKEDIMSLEYRIDNDIPNNV